MDKFWTDVVLKPILERLGTATASGIVSLAALACNFGACVVVPHDTAQAIGLGVVAFAGVCLDLALAWRRKKKDQKKGALAALDGKAAALIHGR